MKVVVTGVCGQLGFDVAAELASRGLDDVGTDVLPEAAGLPEAVPYLQLDITDAAAVSRAIEELRPDVVIHCAAWTAVDAA